MGGLFKDRYVTCLGRPAGLVSAKLRVVLFKNIASYQIKKKPAPGGLTTSEVPGNEQHITIVTWCGNFNRMISGINLAMLMF